jgi:biopolymer transport protein ExbD
MAEFIESGKKTGKRSTRVDLTPMVDLGFLLITFFIFTTALSKPKGLRIFLPKSVPDKERTLAPESGVLTILLGGDKQIYYYEGNDPQSMQRVREEGIRQVILDKKNKTSLEKFIVLIKPGRDSNFQTLIKVIDEMTINDVKKYAMVDLEPGEISLMQKK